MTVYLYYGYTDASNYKQSGSIRLTEELTLRQARQIIDTLDGGAYFIPSQVGIPALPYSRGGTEDDHPWHNLHGLVEAVENAESTGYFASKYIYSRMSEDTVSDAFTPKLLVNAFIDASVAGWDEFADS